MSRHFYPLLAAALAAGGAAASPPADALEAGDWFARFGLTHVRPDDSSGTVSPTTEGAVGPGTGVDVGADTRPSFTVAYMATDNLAIELLGAMPFKHDIEGAGSISGLGKIAETKHLPPTLSLQYHFAPDAGFRPYAGLGLNYTTFFSEKTTGALEGTSISLEDSWGLAAQLGADIDVRGDWFLNGDVRYIDIDTEATLGNGDRVDVSIDPWVFTLAVGRRF